MKENGSEVFYEILGKERGTKELYHAEDEKDLRGRAFFSCARSEERRVGKECRSRWSPYH